jgi:hypothetical protein
LTYQQYCIWDFIFENISFINVFISHNYSSVNKSWIVLENQLQGLFYQDAEMQRMFSAFPEIIFVDANCKLNDMIMPLYVIL